MHNLDPRPPAFFFCIGEDMHQPLHWLRGDFEYGRNITVVAKGKENWDILGPISHLDEP
jgi:hypothetical protein